MFDKMKAVWAVFQTGQSVVNPKAWKMHQVSANAIAALLFAIVQLAKAFGYDLGVDMQTCADIAIGLLAVANVGITVASSDKIGLPATLPPVPSVQQTAPGATPPEAVPLDSEAVIEQHSVDTIDEDTRSRAIEWAREHSATNGLASDA